MSKGGRYKMSQVCIQDMCSLDSDNAHHAPIYYIGDYAPGSSFDPPSTKRGRAMDLGGPTFYAPNVSAPI